MPLVAVSSVRPVSVESKKEKLLLLYEMIFMCHKEQLQATNSVRKSVLIFIARVGDPIRKDPGFYFCSDPETNYSKCAECF
jgi:hypothetical protein